MQNTKASQLLKIYLFAGRQGLSCNQKKQTAELRSAKESLSADPAEDGWGPTNQCGWNPNLQPNPHWGFPRANTEFSIWGDRGRSSRSSLRCAKFDVNQDYMKPCINKPDICVQYSLNLQKSILPQKTLSSNMSPKEHSHHGVNVSIFLPLQ